MHLHMCLRILRRYFLLKGLILDAYLKPQLAVAGLASVGAALYVFRKKARRYALHERGGREGGREWEGLFFYCVVCMCVFYT